VSNIGASEQREDVPSPDDPRKPASPPELRPLSWRYAAKRAAREFLADQCIDSAGALTYFGVVSAFPGLLVVLSLLGVLGLGRQASSALVAALASIAPGPASTALRGPIEQFTSSSAVGLALILGLVLALWTASGYVSAFARAMNRIYEIDEGRPYFKRKAQQLLITVVLVLLVTIMVLIITVSGPVAHALAVVAGVGGSLEVVWAIVKWPILAIALVAMIALLYYGTPNVKQPRFRWLGLGGLVALAVLVVASTAFIFYVADFSHYGKSYGSLAGAIVFLVWLFIANLALLFGGEFESELERNRELQAGIPAEVTIQLPPRDTAASQKAADRLERDEAFGREIREQHAHPR
jgi:membrane protein